MQEDEYKQEPEEDDEPMDWDATDRKGILRELKQCREDLQLNPTRPSTLQEFPANMFGKM